jgi:hypothetical protein
MTVNSKVERYERNWWYLNLMYHHSVVLKRLRKTKENFCQKSGSEAQSQVSILQSGKQTVSLEALSLFERQVKFFVGIVYFNCPPGFWKLLI